MYKNTDGSQKCCVEQQQKPDKKSTIIYIYLNTQKNFLGDNNILLSYFGWWF